MQRTDLQKEINLLKKEISKVNINYGNTTQSHEITLFSQDFIDKCSSEIEITLKELKDETNLHLIDSKIKKLITKIDERIASLYLQLFPPVS